MALLAVLGVCTYGFILKGSDTIFPNVYVAGVNVGGLKRDAAINAVKLAVEQETAADTLTVVLPDRTIEFTPEVTNVALNPDEAADAAINYGRDGGPIKALITYQKAKKDRQDIALESGKNLDTTYIRDLIDQTARACASEKIDPIVTVDADAKTAPAVNCPMAQISADKVTDEMLANIINKTKDAIKKGDETLKGDAGTGILDKLDGNVAKNPNASDKTKQEATDAEKEVDVNKEPAQTTPSAKTDNAKTDNNAGSQSSNNGSSNSGSASSKPSKPAHTHTWVNHTATRQVWVSNWVDVPDYETKTIYGGQLYTEQPDGTWLSNGETYWFYTDADFEAFKNLIVEKMKTEGYCGNYVNRTKTEKVQVGSHKEDHGSYSTETYVDYVYCTSCGAHQ